MIRRAPLLVTMAMLVALVVAGCTGDDAETADGTADGTRATTTTVVESSTTADPPTFTGDPDSAFCAEILAAADRPLLDPFEAGLDAREIELRVRALVVRFEQLATVAPPELTDDVASVGGALRALDATLADHDYDLGAAGEAGADLSFLDDPAFESVAVRIASYTEQVCRRP